MEPILRDSVNVDWITIIILSSILFLVLAKSLFYSRFLNFIILPFNNKYIFLYNKKDRLINWFHIFFTIFQLLNFSLFLYLVVTILYPEVIVESSFLYLIILGLIFVFLFIKILIQLGNSFVFNNQKIIEEILFKKITYLNYSSIVMFLANVILTYVFIDSKMVVFITLSIIFSIISIGWITIIKSHLKFLTSYFFYFILYLCALEIAPIVIIVNYLKD